VLPSHSYQCGDLAVTATFDGVGAVDLSWPGGPLTLPKVESASGERYADSRGNEFWSKGEEAMFTLVGQEKRNCTAAPTGG
jgi:membrane-bound inhibitor of C-type lysozyme